MEMKELKCLHTKVTDCNYNMKKGRIRTLY